MSESRHPDPASDALTDLREAAERYREARADVEEYGRDALENLAAALRRARSLLRQYEDTATDTGAREFVKFAEFKSNFVSLVEDADDDLPGRDALAAARDRVDKNRLDEEDFERAREALAPAERLVERIDDLEAARDDLVAARKRARRRRDDLRAELRERERVLELGDADLDAPTEDLRDPIERWNEAVREGVEAHLAEAPARETVALLERADLFPLVPLPTPPEHLREFVVETPAGDHSVRELLEYADYSRSKLAHYVEDADRLKREVATERTFLESLDAEALTVGWPPPPVERVPWLARELRAVAGRLAGEDGVAALREVESIARDRQRYRRLRDAAVAEVRLDPEDRRRLEAGTVADEIAEREAAIERLEAALEEAPDP